jgi:hypothetical protein
MTSEMSSLGSAISPQAASSVRGVSVEATTRAVPKAEKAEVSKPAEMSA